MNTPTARRRRYRAVADNAAQVLRREILNGRHFPGEQLREVKTAQRLKVSRNSFRQACKSLTEEGLLTHVPHTGVFISQISADQVAEIYAFRQVAECGTLATLTPAKARSLGKKLTELTNTITPDSRLGDANNNFHLAIIDASESSILHRVAESVFAQLRLCFISNPDTHGLHMEFAERHHDIARALQKGEQQTAYQLLSTYLNESFKSVTTSLTGPRH